jgi:protein phosphatase
MTNDPTQPAPRPTTGLAWGIATHAGRVRDQNEDSGHASPWLFVVADGMGGHQAGEVASELTVTTITNACTPAPIGAAETPLAHPHLSDLVKSVVDANTAIFRASLDNPSQQGMGTTVTALALIVDDTDPDTPHALGLVNVGDSRTYLHRHNRLRQITIDHSFVQELVDQGQITAFEARYHPRRNIVTRALGIEPDVRVDSWRLPLMRGDRYVLCSDGLVDEVDDESVGLICASHPDPQGCADALVAAALENGGRDNVTVIVVDVLDGDDPTDPTEEYDLESILGADEVTGEIAVITSDATPDGVVRPVGGAGVEPDPVDGAGVGGRRSRIARWAAAVAVAAAVMILVAVTSAWVRSGYTVQFTEAGTVMIYRGRDILWFSPTQEAPGQFSRDELDDISIRRVEQSGGFATLDDAARFVQELTTTTTTVPVDDGDGDAVAVTTTTVRPRPTTTTTTAG